MKKNFILLILLTFVFINIRSVACATVIRQWADEVIDFSSQWSSTGWSAEQALESPDTWSYGDIPTAWAPLNENGTLEWLTLGFSIPVYANRVVIKETWGNGFVYQVDVLDMNDDLYEVWSGTDPTLPGEPERFVVDFAQTDFLVKGVKIYVDTDHNLYKWEEIDAVLLRGSIPEPATILLLLSGMIVMVALKKNVG